jgi:hypothetical protein
MSAIKPKRMFVVDLQKDKEAKKPEAAIDDKKQSRLLLIGCPPIPGIQAWSIKTADGKLHEVTGTELK